MTTEFKVLGMFAWALLVVHAANITVFFLGHDWCDRVLVVGVLVLLAGLVSITYCKETRR